MHISRALVLSQRPSELINGGDNYTQQFFSKQCPLPEALVLTEDSLKMQILGSQFIYTELEILGWGLAISVIKPSS